MRGERGGGEIGEEEERGDGARRTERCIMCGERERERET